MSGVWVFVIIFWPRFGVEQQSFLDFPRISRRSPVTQGMDRKYLIARGGKREAHQHQHHQLIITHGRIRDGAWHSSQGLAEAGTSRSRPDIIACVLVLVPTGRTIAAIER